MGRSCYVDTSCMLKLLIPERESGAIAEVVESEDDVVVSTLTEVEVRSHLLALRRGGSIRFVDYRAAVKKFEELGQMDPFRAALLGGDVFDVAIGHLKKRGVVHCRSLERLHLAAMQSLALDCLITNDRQQAKAAKSLGFTVIHP
jgi:predicted nucleic acid-binding protein